MLPGSIRTCFDTQGTTETSASLSAVCRLCAATVAACAVLLVALWLGVVQALGRADEALLLATAASMAIALIASLGMFAEIRRRLGRDDQPLVPAFVLLLLVPVLVAVSGLMLAAIRAGGPGRFTALVLAGAQLPGLLLAAPLLLALALKMNHHFRTLTQILQFDMVGPSEVPPRVAKFFDRVTPEIEAAEFRRVADYRQKSDDRQFSRVWRSPDGTQFAEATVARLLCCQMTCTSCVSLLADGTLLECGTADLPRSGVDEHRLCLRSAPRADFAELRSLHAATLDALRESHGDPLPLTLDDYQVVTHYGILLTHRHLIREGVLGGTPYEPLAAQVEASIESLIAEPAGVLV